MTHTHSLVVTWYRPWRRCFRLTRRIRCWECDLLVEEP